MALVVLAAMLWGTSGTAQSLAPAQLSPYWVGALRVAFAAVFFALLAGPRGWAAAPPWPWRQLAPAALCIAGYNLSFFAGVKYSGVALGTALAIGSGPLWAGLLEALWLRRWPSRLWWLGTVLSVAGGAAMALGQGGALRLSGLGVALCLLAGLCYAVYALLSKSLVLQLGPRRTNLGVFFLASVLSLPLAWALGGALHTSARGWAVALYLGLVSSGLAYLLFTTALRHISGATGVTLALCEPVTAFGLAIVVVGEAPQALAYLGLALVLAGLALVVWAEVRAQAAPGMVKNSAPPPME